jgi:isopentenyl-diphosphate Delta-isomerase
MQSVILVDERDRELGSLDKLQAHLSPGTLHRAVSVFVFDRRGNLMLQRRAEGKYHFVGRWSNTSCTHPSPGERLEVAGRRSLLHEMGLRLEVRPLLSVVYRATDEGTSLVEHEFDHVLVGQYDGAPRPNPAEVDGWKWMEPVAILSDLHRNPGDYSPWLRIALDLILAYSGGDRPSG